jgi:hypothetical protein
MIRTFEEENPEVCLRVRYEDLVADSQAQADRLFEFIGEKPVPGLASILLDHELGQFGPSDHKIWETGNIHDNSVGRGHRIPADAIPPQVLDMVNRLLAELAYEQIGSNWGQPSGLVAEEIGATSGQVAAVATLQSLEDLLASRIAVAAETSQAVPDQRGSFLLTGTAPTVDGSSPVVRSWLVDPAEGVVTTAGNPDAEPMSDVPSWQVSGLAITWVNVLTGQLGVATALRRRLLRLGPPQQDEAGEDSSANDYAAQTGTLYRLFGQRHSQIEYAKEQL